MSSLLSQVLQGEERGEIECGTELCMMEGHGQESGMITLERRRMHGWLQSLGKGNLTGIFYFIIVIYFATSI